MENIDIDIDYLIKNTPNVLETHSKDVIRVGNYYLPYSTGIEIECEQSAKFNVEEFINIPNIMDVNIDKFEQRFRIPPGIKGLVCLYQISNTLSKNSLLNLDSGNHYHIDFTDSYELLSEEGINDNEEWILRELDSWEYKGTYNRRACKFNTNHNWVRFQEGFKTMEIRIGEMTFDYGLLFKRITHANHIARKLKNKIDIAFKDSYNLDEESVIKNRIKII